MATCQIRSEIRTQRIDLSFEENVQYFECRNDNFDTASNSYDRR